MDLSKNYYKSYGNRTSSLVSLYSHFNSYIDGRIDGEIRFIEKKSVIGIANEPLCSNPNKGKLLLQFVNKQQFKKKDILIFPIGEYLASELDQQGMYVWQIGVEPIFKLHDYFSEIIDPIENFPIVRSLKKRGAKVIELKEDDIENYRELIEEIKDEWLGSKKTEKLEFLNAVEPFSHEEFKRYFLLKDKEDIKAVLVACPIYFKEQIIAYYFNDVLKRNSARSGSSELLIIESMRKLHTEGVLEVRLGMCPLADIDDKNRDAKELQKIFSSWKMGYNFKTLYQFKTKLNPSLMRPLYIASNKSSLYRLLKNVVRLHFSSPNIPSIILKTWYKNRSRLKLKPELSPLKKTQHTLGFFSKIKFTSILAISFISLHLIKNSTDIGKEIFDMSAYIPGSPSILGIFLGPLFHNHAKHIIGDQVSFFIFGAAIEYTFGAKLMLLITSFGLWLSNPLTHLALFFTLKPISASWWNIVLNEKDYGTSNAVFALVGAAVFMLRKNMWIFIPFLINALYVCIQRQSFLAIHHITGIAIGYIFTKLYFRKELASK